MTLSRVSEFQVMVSGVIKDSLKVVNGGEVSTNDYSEFLPHTVQQQAPQVDGDAEFLQASAAMDWWLKQCLQCLWLALKDS